MRRFVMLTLLVASAFLLLPRTAAAYLDPATGSFVIQGLIAGLVTVGFVLKLYWRKLAELLSRLVKGKPTDDGE